jgi:hypothetical protein
MNFDWGTQPLVADEKRSFKFGKLELELTPNILEWLIEYGYDQDRYVNQSAKSITRLRTIIAGDEFALQLSPASSDRNVVVRPAQKIAIPHGQTIRLFIGTPVWLVGTHTSLEHKLFDLSSEILSDTWFGPNTYTGEICYANETQARLDLNRLTLRPDRLITPVTIINNGGDTLTLERLNLPIPYLSIFDAGPNLWTQEISLKRTGKMESAGIKFPVEPPAHAPESPCLAGPRQSAPDNLIERAYNLLLDERKSI